MLENPDFEQNYYSKAIEGINKIEHDSFRLMKCLAYYDRSFNEISYFDLMGTIVKFKQTGIQR